MASTGKPPEVTSLDHQILSHGGTTSTVDYLPHRLRKTKELPPPSAVTRIEELTRENGYLRKELALHHENRTTLMTLYAKSIEAHAILQQALENILQKVALSETELLRHWGIPLNDNGDEIHLL